MYVYMGMTDTTNARKVQQVGNNIGITFPNARLEEFGIEKGQYYKLRSTPEGFEAIQVEFRRPALDEEEDTA